MVEIDAKLQQNFNAAFASIGASIAELSAAFSALAEAMQKASEEEQRTFALLRMERLRNVHGPARFLMPVWWRCFWLSRRWQ